MVAASVRPARVRAQHRLGTLLKGKYNLDQLLGAGGMGAVYLATHRNGRKVAIKVLHSEFAEMDEVRERFLQEGYAANKVGHPGVVSIDDDDVAEDGSVFLVMELLEGETLGSRLRRRNKKLPASEVLCVIDPVLDILIAAHERGIIHRDIKPDNIFITSQGQVKLLDFGIAKVLDAANKNLTQTGVALGTPTYMSPEQARGQRALVSARTDLWSVGAVLFTAVSGQHVHSAPSPAELLIAAGITNARSLVTAAPNVHPSLVALVDKALQYDQADRWPSAAIMMQQLRRCYALIVGRIDSSDESAMTLGPLPAPPVDNIETIVVDDGEDNSAESGKLVHIPIPVGSAYGAGDNAPTQLSARGTSGVGPTLRADNPPASVGSLVTEVDPAGLRQSFSQANDPARSKVVGLASTQDATIIQPPTKSVSWLVTVFAAVLVGALVIGVYVATRPASNAASSGDSARTSTPIPTVFGGPSDSAATSASAPTASPSATVSAMASAPGTASSADKQTAPTKPKSGPKPKETFGDFR